MAYKVQRSVDCIHDLELIFEHLINSFTGLGEPLDDAFSKAEERIFRIEDEMDQLIRAPFQGTLMKDVLPSLRRVTKNRAIYYFVPDVQTETIVVLAVFFGGQDHIFHMLNRLLKG